MDSIKTSKFKANLLSKPEKNWFNLIKSLNTYRNISDNKDDGIDLGPILVEMAKKMKSKKMRIPAGGYLNLIAIVDGKETL